MDGTESKQSVFNAGVAQAERIDSLQRAYNASSYNPLMMNPETNTFNYQVMITSCDRLIDEAWGKLSNSKDKPEKKQAQQMKEIVYAVSKSLPPIRNIETRQGQEIQINQEYYNRLIKLIDIYYRLAKELLENHDLNSPNKDWDDDEGL